MSKQLSLSATFAVLAMAAFALATAPSPLRLDKTGAPVLADAPALVKALPGF